MKFDQTILTKIIILMAPLAIPAQLRLVAQDQPQPQQSQAASTPANYNFLIASGFLCDPPNADICPAVARASDGESIEISGAGTLDLAGKSVTGAGPFTEKSLDGYIVTTGVWTAIALVSFQSYGIDPGALLRDYPQFRRLGQFGIGGPKMPGSMPGRMLGPMAALMAGPVAAGGLAVIRIHLLPDAGTPTEALLRVNCAKGTVPEDEQSDGVRLTVTRGPAFDEQVNGRTVFLLQRAGPNFALKSPPPTGAER